MADRRRPKRAIAKDVLIAARRRCCLCVFLLERNEPRQGQIAHLDRDRRNSRFNNLVFLCFEHHNEYDSQTRQSKGLLREEVREYRDRLYAQNRDAFAIAIHAAERETAELEPLPNTSQFNALRKHFPDKFENVDTAWRFPLWQVADEPELFAYKASNRMDGICLIERIDLPDGRIAVVCVATSGNPGNSITNSVETLCLQVCERFDIPPNKLVWIEHYDFFEPQEWDLVTFGKMPPEHLFQEPTWTPITDAMWKSLGLRPKRNLKSFSGSYQSKASNSFRGHQTTDDANWQGIGRPHRILILDSLLPGTPTIPEQIAMNKEPYYKALEEADKAWAQDKVDVSALEELLGDMLAQQLVNAA
jgi:hypothetical protein